MVLTSSEHLLLLPTQKWSAEKKEKPLHYEMHTLTQVK